MVEEPEMTPDPTPPAPKRKKRKILLILVVCLFLAGGGGLAFLVLLDDPGISGTSPESAHSAHSEGVIMSLQPFLVNLADRETRRYLKLKVELEVGQEANVKELEKSVVRIRDAMILLLSSKNYADISTLEGKHQLKKDIVQKLAAIPGGKQVRGVFFTEFVAQ